MKRYNQYLWIAMLVIIGFWLFPSMEVRAETYTIDGTTYDTDDAVTLSNDYATSYLFEDTSTLLVTYYKINSGLSFNSPSVQPYYGYTFENVIFSDDILDIPAYAFQGNTYIKTVRFSNRMRWIWSYAFQGCTNLGETGLEFPRSLLQIESYAFQGCTNIKGDLVLNIPMRTSGYIKYDDDGDGNYINYLWKCWLGSYCFADCCIEGDLIVNGTSCLGQHAFENTTFSGDCYINNDTSKSWTYYVPKYCFYKCSFDGTISISDRLYDIKEYAFSYCSAKSLTFIENTTNAVDIQSCAFQYSNIKGQLVLPDNVGDILSEAFMGSAFEGELYMPSLSAYGYSMFKDCTRLTSIVFEDTTILARSMFAGCTGLTQEVELPVSLKKIPASLFEDCSNLQGNLQIPNNVTSIGEYAFYNCTNLMGNLVLSENLTEICSYAFYECSGLNELHLDSAINLEYIGDYAFYSCSNLTGSIYLPDSLSNYDYAVGEYAFANCTKLTGPVKFPEEFSRIPAGLFYNCSSLNCELNIPKSVTFIGVSAFEDCTSLSGISSEFYCGIANSAFKNCSSMQGDIIFAKDADTFSQYVSDYAFYNCTSLDGKLDLGNTYFIGTSAFENCAFTGNLTVPESVHEIQQRAFYNCSSFSDTITFEYYCSIGDYAFYNMYGVSNINGVNGYSYFPDYNSMIFGLSDYGVKTKSDYLYSTDYRDEFWNINRYPISVNFIVDGRLDSEYYVFNCDGGKVELPAQPSTSNIN